MARYLRLDSSKLLDFGKQRCAYRQGEQPLSMQIDAISTDCSTESACRVLHFKLQVQTVMHAVQDETEPIRGSDLEGN
jgi:hypothetical protein